MNPPLVPDSVGPFKSLQEVFNRAWEWSRTHDAAIERTPTGNKCVYRSPNGTNACLIGACIPDSVLPNGLDGDIENVYDNNREWFISLFPFVVGQDYSVDDEGTKGNSGVNDLMALQTCHDNAALSSQPTASDVDDSYLARVTKNLRKFAENRDLTVLSL